MLPISNFNYYHDRRRRLFRNPNNNKYNKLNLYNPKYSDFDNQKYRNPNTYNPKNHDNVVNNFDRPNNLNRRNSKVVVRTSAVPKPIPDIIPFQTVRQGEVTLNERRGDVVIRNQLRLPKLLNECPLIQRILNTPCNVTLNQPRYNIIQQTRFFTLTSGSNESRLYLCLLNSILKEMSIDKSLSISETNKYRQHNSACVGGWIQVVIQGAFQSPKQRVISQASSYFIPKSFQSRPEKIQDERKTLKMDQANQLNKSCSLLYIPISVTWTQDKSNIIEAIESVNDKQRWFCSNCEPGHAMALIADSNSKTIQVYDSNGIGASYYEAIIQWIDDQLNGPWSNLFSDYSLLNDVNIPQFGIQTNTGIAMCGYFSALYAAIRITCPYISPLDLNHALLEIPKSQIFNLLNLWHCFIIQYAKQKQLLTALQDVPDLFTQIFNRLINPHIYLKSLPKENVQVLWNRLNRLQYISDIDLIKTWKELQQQVRDIDHLS